MREIPPPPHVRRRSRGSIVCRRRLPLPKDGVEERQGHQVDERGHWADLRRTICPDAWQSYCRQSAEVRHDPRQATNVPLQVNIYNLSWI